MAKRTTLAISLSAAVVAGVALAQDQGVQGIIGNVLLQDTSRGTVQAGHAAIGGTFRAGQVNVASANATIPVIGNNNATDIGGVGASFSSAGANGVGLRSTSTAVTGQGSGVLGVGRSPAGFGVLGSSNSGVGVFGQSAGGPAGVFARNNGLTPALLAENLGFGDAIQSLGNVSIRGNFPLFTLKATGGDGNVTSQARNGGFFSIFAPVTSRSSAMDIDRSTHRTYLALNGIQAQMFIDSTGKGVVSADVKNFVQPDPDDLERDIVYASVEGPEAAAYVRGTARLVGGTIRVSFPRHFQNVSLEEGLTVQLTPRSAASEGLAVVTRSLQGFVVQELRGGKGAYEFDWEAKAVRRGFGDYSVYRRWDEHIAIGDDRETTMRARIVDAKRAYSIDYSRRRP